MSASLTDSSHSYRSAMVITWSGQAWHQSIMQMPPRSCSKWKIWPLCQSPTTRTQCLNYAPLNISEKFWSKPFILMVFSATNPCQLKQRIRKCIGELDWHVVQGLVSTIKARPASSCWQRLPFTPLKWLSCMYGHLTSCPLLSYPCVETFPKITSFKFCPDFK